MHNGLFYKMLSFLFLSCVASCSSQQQPPITPACDYSLHTALNQQINSFIWADAAHITFSPDWQLVAIEQMSKKYGYLQRKSLPDAVQADKELQYFKSQVNLLLVNNMSLLSRIENTQCIVSDGDKSAKELEQQNLSIAYILNYMPDLFTLIASKKEIILESLEKR